MATKSPKSTLSLETGMLSFSRSIQITEGLFFGSGPDHQGKDRLPIAVFDKGVRGQSSEAKTDSEGKSNPQVVDAAVVPQGCDLLELDFSVRVLPMSLKPHACGDADVRKAYVDIADAYKTANGFATLALLYVWNIANARFAWRNRYQVDTSVVTVSSGNLFSVSFDPFKLSLDDNASRDDLIAATDGKAESVAGIDALLAGFVRGLSTKGEAFSFDVRWSADVVAGQEVFPSQEYIRKEKKDDDSSRVYAKLPVTVDKIRIEQASLHSQKIGAALRHIDIWHGDMNYNAIAVNPYGGVQETSEVLRASKNKNSFYDIRKKADDLLAGIVDGAITPDAHFFMANLVRGGVFGVKA